jgi:hypothetical protein
MSESLEERVAKLEFTVVEAAAQKAALRDITARLLAYLAASQDDPEELLRHFSESGDVRIDRPGLTKPDLLHFAEVSRREKDWIVAAAREML